MQTQDSNSETSPPVAPEGSCHFFVKKKKRFCKLKPNQGQQYCAEHALQMGADLERKRVQCPYESKHTCYADKLKHHMKKCPSRPREMPPYYSASINSGDDAGEIVPEPKQTVLTVPEEELKVLIEKVNRLYDEHVGDIQEEILTHDCLQGELENATYGTAALRHRKQQASLIGHMDKLGLLRDKMCYLEMGAGKGQLSHWLHEAVVKYKDDVFVLIDRSHVRNKMDNLHKEEEVMERLRIDIEHLRLGQVPTIQKHDKPVVAFGKHLCGPATDLSLRCVCETLNHQEEGQGDEGTQRKRLKSENRCTWTPYVGKRFFQDAGLTARDFQILSSMTSWATCAWKGWSAKRKQDQRSGAEASDPSGGDKKAEDNSATDDVKRKQGQRSDAEESAPSGGDKEPEPSGGDKKAEDNSVYRKEKDSKLDPDVVESDSNNIRSESVEMKESGDAIEGLEGEKRADGQMEGEGEGAEDEHRPDVPTVSSSINQHFSQEEREVIGRRCKRLIDFGRLLYLRDHGLNSSMKIYIEEFYTPENIVLLASS